MPKYRRKEEEMQENAVDTAMENKVNEAPQESEDSEEATFKKRYGDLRRHLQQTVENKDRELERLKAELQEKSKEEFKLPTSEEEIEAWAQKFPEVAKIVDSIAQKRAREASTQVEQSMSDLRKMKSQLEREKAEHQLTQMHPDFGNIRQDPAFHEWVGQQPEYIKDALYRNETDAVAAARAIDLYKADKGIIAQKRSDTQLKKEAAQAVPKASSGSPAASSNAKWSESRVAGLTAHQYEKHEEEILEAIQSNKFVYDMTGGAR